MRADTLEPSDSPARGLSPVQWLICIIAAIGFAFDIYELLVAPLILPPAMQEMSPFAAGTPEFIAWVGRWKGLMFFIPAFVGGAFGLVGGYLTDRLGRRRVLTWSILLYAISAFLAGFSTSVWMLLFLRCTTFIGVCVEFVAAVAWLAELFPHPKTRERVLGFTQAFSSFGGLMVAGVFYLTNKHGDSLPALQIPGFLQGWLGDIRPNLRHEAWRYTLMSGLIPALPLILIRPFLPESPVWARSRAAGTLRRPSFAELFSPQLRRTTVVTTIMFACSYGAAFGAIQQMPDIAPGLPDVQAKVAAAVKAASAGGPTKPAATGPTTHGADAGPTTSAIAASPAGSASPEKPAKFSFPASAPSAANAPGKGRPDPRVAKARRSVEQEQASRYTGFQENGGLVGRFVLAAIAASIVSRRKLLRIFQLPGLFIVPLVFAYAALYNRTLFHIGSLDVTLFAAGMFLAGMVTVAQFSFWGNYLPLVYPVHLRGTGESFSANLGGRMIGTSFAWVTSTVAASALYPADMPLPKRFAYTAAAVALFVYVVGFVCSFFLPEPPREQLPEGAGRETV